MKSYKSIIRHAVIVLIFTSFVLFYVGDLFSLQVANRYNYSVNDRTTTKRSVTVKALRGKIYDRNGVLLVTNKIKYGIEIDKQYVNDNELPDTLHELFSLLDENNISLNDRFAVTKSEPFAFEDNYFTDYKKIFAKFEASDIGIRNYTATELMDYLIEKYSLRKYSKVEARRIIGQIFEMNVSNYDIGNPYIIAESIDSEIINNIADKLMLIKGLNLSTVSERVILNGDLAAHILGTVGKIFEEDYPKYAAEGYSMDAVVGRSGVEKAFEEYLRGFDGTIIQTVDKNGTILEAHYDKEPIAGKDVYLTIDANLQRSTQNALEKTILRVSRNSETKKGRDANAGAIVVQDPNNAEILAIASYPTYDLSKYNELYSELSVDESAPLLNRALVGTYAPGSTYKLMTSIAALEEKIIYPDTQIYDKGTYTKYAPSYTPHCWIYNSKKRTHGIQDVISALQNSCNYFFFEVGDKLGIDKLEEYSRRFGLGEPTGIEIGEASGVLAGPTYRNAIQSDWFLGDTLQAAIGQSDNLFTPIQISNYMSTILNGGTRYQTHLLYCVKNFYANSVYYKMPPNILSRTTISDSTYDVIKTAMKKVVEDGTASTMFNKFRVAVGGKTGSAQVSRGSSNAIFIGFAPYEQPEIVVTVVIEHGSTGSNAAYGAKLIFDDYFPK